jgi:transposase
MKPYSLDLRERVVARVAAGEPVRSVAAAFDVSVSSVVKWSQRWRATGSAAAKPMGGKRRDVMVPARDHVLARLAEDPSLALRALQAELARQGIRVSYGAIWRFVRREGLSFKKSRSSPRRSSVPTSRAAVSAGSATSTE